MKTGGACAGGEEAELEMGFVAGEEDGAEGEVGVQGASETGGQDERGLFSRDYGTDGFVSIALAHAGQEDLDVEAGGDGGFEGRGFFFDGETNECER